MAQNLPDNADMRDMGSIPSLGRYAGGGHGNPLQYSYLQNPMDRGAWRATAHRVAKDRTGLKQLSMNTQKRLTDLENELMVDRGKDI